MSRKNTQEREKGCLVVIISLIFMHKRCCIAVVSIRFVELKTYEVSCAIGHTAYGLIDVIGFNAIFCGVDVLNS